MCSGYNVKSILSGYKWDSGKYHLFTQQDFKVITNLTDCYLEDVVINVWIKMV